VGFCEKKLAMFFMPALSTLVNFFWAVVILAPCEAGINKNFKDLKQQVAPLVGALINTVPKRNNAPEQPIFGLKIFNSRLCELSKQNKTLNFILNCIKIKGD